MNRAVGLTLVFVGIVGAIVGTTLIVGVGPGAPPADQAIENPQYEDPDLLVDTDPGTADVSLESAESTNTILLDPEGFGTADRDVLPLTNALTDAGHEIEVRAGESLDTALEGVDGVVTIGMSGYSADELEALREFADDGGRVIIAIEPADEFDGDLSAAELRSEFGVSVTPGYVYNVGENDLNYQRIFAEPAQDSAVTDGVDRVVFQTATPVDGRSTDGTIEPVDGSLLSTTRTAVEDPVLVHDGNVVVVGDTQFFRPENTQRADNDVLVGNLGDFLVTGTTGSSTPPGNETTAVTPAR